MDTATTRKFLKLLDLLEVKSLTFQKYGTSQVLVNIAGEDTYALLTETSTYPPAPFAGV